MLRSITVLLFGLLLTSCKDSSAPAGEPVDIRPPWLIEFTGPFAPPAMPAVFLSLRGTDAMGGIHPVATTATLIWSDPETGERRGEASATTDINGNLVFTLAPIVDSYVYEIKVAAPDDWYFLPESVAYFYGRSMSGSELREIAGELLSLQFAPNGSGIAYVEEVGTVEDFRDRFPGGNGSDIVYEITISAPNLHDRLYRGECEYYFEDLYFADAAGDTPVYTTREVFEGPADCSQNFGAFLAAVSHVSLRAPDFWNGLQWDSLIFMDPADEDEEAVILFTQSSRFYVADDFYGND